VDVLLLSNSKEEMTPGLEILVNLVKDSKRQGWFVAKFVSRGHIDSKNQTALVDEAIRSAAVPSVQSVKHSLTPPEERQRPGFTRQRRANGVDMGQEEHTESRNAAPFQQHHATSRKSGVLRDNPHEVIEIKDDSVEEGDSGDDGHFGCHDNQSHTFEVTLPRDPDRTEVIIAAARKVLKTILEGCALACQKQSALIPVLNKDDKPFFLEGSRLPPAPVCINKGGTDFVCPFFCCAVVATHAAICDHLRVKHYFDTNMFSIITSRAEFPMHDRWDHKQRWSGKQTPDTAPGLGEGGWKRTYFGDTQIREEMHGFHSHIHFYHGVTYSDKKRRLHDSDDAGTEVED
jgi:hypothetical protein